MAAAAYRTAWVGTGVTGAPYYFTLYCLPGTTPQTFSDAVHDFLQGTRAHFPLGQIWTSTGTVETWDAGAQQVTASAAVTTVPVTCSGTGDVLATQVQLYTKFMTGQYVTGRQVQGGKYLGAMLESANTPTGSPDPTVVADFASKWAALQAAAPLAVNSKKHLAVYPVNGLLVESMWATQRRRSQRG